MLKFRSKLVNFLLARLEDLVELLDLQLIVVAQCGELTDFRSQLVHLARNAQLFFLSVQIAAFKFFQIALQRLDLSVAFAQLVAQTVQFAVQIIVAQRLLLLLLLLLWTGDSG